MRCGAVLVNEMHLIVGVEKEFPNFEALVES